VLNACIAKSCSKRRDSVVLSEHEQAFLSHLNKMTTIILAFDPDQIMTKLVCLNNQNVAKLMNIAMVKF